MRRGYMKDILAFFILICPKKRERIRVCDSKTPLPFRCEL